MIKKTITYDTYDGETLTEDFYFNLSKADIARLDLSMKGGMAATLQRLIKAEDGKTIMQIMEEIILTSYGVRSEDSKRFEKSAELSAFFKDTDAYSELFYELVTDAEKASEFVNGLLPAKLMAEVEKNKQASAPKLESVPEPPKNTGMTEEQLREALAQLSQSKPAE